MSNIARIVIGNSSFHYDVTVSLLLCAKKQRFMKLFLQRKKQGRRARAQANLDNYNRRYFAAGDIF